MTYANFPSMCAVGDSIFVGRYLATGDDKSSLFLEVRRPGAPTTRGEAQLGQSSTRAKRY